MIMIFATTQSSGERVSRTHSLIRARMRKKIPQRRLSVLHPRSVMAKTLLKIYLKSGFPRQTETTRAEPKMPSKRVSLRMKMLGMLMKSDVPPKRSTEPDERRAKIGVCFSRYRRTIRDMTVAIIMTITPAMKFPLSSKATRKPRMGPNSQSVFMSNFVLIICVR